MKKNNCIVVTYLFVCIVISLMLLACGDSGRNDGNSTGEIGNKTDTTPPANVSGFAAVVGNARVVLNWTNPADSDFNNVIIRRSTGDYPATVSLGTAVYSGTGVNYVDSNVVNGTLYFYSIFTVDSSGNVSSGVNAQATPQGQLPDVTPPADVSGFSAAPLDSTIQLSWVNPLDLDFQGVMVRRSTAVPPASVNDGLLVYQGNSTTYTDQNLNNGTQYYYTIFAYDVVLNYSSGFSTQSVPVADAFSIAAQFGSYLGGTYFERTQSVFIDDAGFIYIGGHTQSENFPVTSGAYDTTKSPPTGGGYDTQDGYVAKLSADGTQIIWATLIGGARRDQVYAVRTDSVGNVYVVGATGSEDFPTTQGAYDETFNGPIVTNGISDIFVASFTPDGTTLRFSTFVGGVQGGEENPRGAFEIDEQRGRIYVAGVTTASDFPTTSSGDTGAPDFLSTYNAYQPNYGGGSDDAFVFALSMDGKYLLASTFVGGSGSDAGMTEIEPHPSGDSFYIGGGTNSADFPITSGVFQRTLASGSPGQPWWQNGDAFIARISANLDQLMFSTFYGGSDADAVSHNQGLAVDGQGRVVIVGHTESSDLPMPNQPYDDSLGGSMDGFVAVFTENGGLAYSTYIGGSDTEEVAGAFVGPQGNIYLTGGTRSDNFDVTFDAYQSTFGNGNAGGGLSDAFLTVFDSQLQNINYSTYLGGSGTQAGAERGRTIWVTANGRVVVGGVTDSIDFPISSPSIQMQHGGDTDAFYMVFDLQP